MAWSTAGFGEKVGFGKYATKTVRWLLTGDPSYASWILGLTDVYGRMRQVQDILRAVRDAFDAAPLKRRCVNCAQPATRISFYLTNPLNPFIWCDSCNPRSWADPGKVVVCGLSFTEILATLDCICGRLSKTELASIMGRISTLRGGMKTWAR